MMKTAISIGLMTVLSGTGVAAWAQAPTTPKPAPTQQAAPNVDPRAKVTPAPEAARDSATAKAATPATPAASATAAKSQQMELQAMDTNKDGLVSKPEYMAHYEGLYGKMKKDSSGMINLKDLAATASLTR